MGLSGWGYGGRADATLSFDCTTCGARPGDLCVYVAPRISDEDLVRWPYLSVRADQAGKTTQVPHQARYAAVHDALNTRSHYAKTKAREAQVKRERNAASIAIRDMYEIRRAMQEQDRRDYNALHVWLRAYGDILFDNPCNPCNT